MPGGAGSASSACRSARSTPAPITVTHAGPAEQALCPLEIKFSQGYPQRECAAFAGRSAAGERVSQRSLCAPPGHGEAAYLRGQHGRAQRAADRLLAVEPNNARALMHKGLIQIADLARADAMPAAWTAARAAAGPRGHAAPQRPVVLRAYLRSYAAAGRLPPEEAQNALYDAMELAPSDGELRYELAPDFEQRGMIPEAIAIIRPEAYQVPDRRHETEREREAGEEQEDARPPRRHRRHETAREMLRRLEARLKPATAQHRRASRPLSAAFSRSSSAALRSSP